LNFASLSQLYNSTIKIVYLQYKHTYNGIKQQNTIHENNNKNLFLINNQERERGRRIRRLLVFRTVGLDPLVIEGLGRRGALAGVHVDHARDDILGIRTDGPPARSI